MLSVASIVGDKVSMFEVVVGTVESIADGNSDGDKDMVNDGLQVGEEVGVLVSDGEGRPVGTVDGSTMIIVVDTLEGVKVG